MKYAPVDDFEQQLEEEWQQEQEDAKKATFSEWACAISVVTFALIAFIAFMKNQSPMN